MSCGNETHSKFRGISGVSVVVGVLLVILGFGSHSSFAYPPSSSSSSGLRGSQQYLQDPWNHEHNYFQKVDVGPHKHGWGWAEKQENHPAHGAGDWPEQATYVQKLIPVFSFSHNLKKLTNHIHSLKPGKHWNSWNSLPALGIFGSDGSAHHVKIAKEPHYEGGWSHNHESHHIGHKLPTKTHYNTW